ncbi:protein SINE1-like [Bidens hawaiensis]|uniref:protein SINE1-like n=1 Tax=Bidens hawaiensis TaxID=980011 RepID=UPI004048F0D7
MHSLCKPLSDSLLSRNESLSLGAARCIIGLVELDDWRFCSSQTVNEVCQRVAAGLEGDAHMGLVMALAKRNGLVVEGYARLLVRAGVRVLNAGVSEGDCRKRLSAIRMVNCLMMSLDYKCIVSELTFVIEEFQKFQQGEIVDVNEAVSEGIHMAKRILWSNADVSFKDGLLSGQVNNPGCVIKTLEAREDYEDEFSGFLLRSSINGGSRSRTPSPQKTRSSYVNADSSNRFTSPRKLSQPLHVSDDGSSRNQNSRFRSSSSSKFNRRSNSNYDQNGFNECFTNKDELFNGTSETVSSTDDILTNGSYHVEECQENVPETKVKSRMSAVKVYSWLFVLLVAVVLYMWVQGIDEGYKLVPT